MKKVKVWSLIILKKAKNQKDKKIKINLQSSLIRFQSIGLKVWPHQTAKRYHYQRSEEIYRDLVLKWNSNQ